jgi:predicted DsbA family dithiol-disulfide isomerase
MKFKRWSVPLFFVFLVMPLSLKSSEAKVRVDWKTLGTFALEKEPLEIVLSPHGRMAYILTKGAVVIYSADENRVIERIPVNEDIDRLWVSPRGNLIYLTSTKSEELSVIRLGFSIEIKRGNSISLGPEDAPVTLVAFMDFQCPFCPKAFSILRDVLDQYPDEVNLIFKHFPLKKHTYAEKAALASLSAYRQGKFLEIAAVFFENPGEFEDKTIDQAAERVGLDMALFKKEMESKSVKRVLDEDIEMGRELLIKGVPAIFINGKQVNNRFLPNLSEMVYGELNNLVSANPGRKGPMAGRITD